MLNCKVDFCVDDQHQSIRQLLRVTSPLFRAGAASPWRLDCSRADYLGPWAAAVLYALSLRAEQQRTSHSVILPTSPARLRAYCEYSGLARHFESGPQPNPDHPATETVPICAFERATLDQASPLVRLIRRHSHIDEDAEAYLRTCISEVAQNVEDHSRSPIGGVLSAKFLRNASEVRVAMVDCGLGIPSTLGVRYPGLTGSIDAIGKVLEGYHSAKTLGRNQGLGIRNLSDIVCNLGGELSIASADALALVRPGRRPSIESEAFSFPGTAVFFRLRL